MNALQVHRWQFSHRCYGWGATSENRSKIGDFAPTRSLWSKISGTRGCPTNNFCTVSYANECLTTLLLIVFTHIKLCSRLSSREVRFYTEIGHFAFLRPPLGDLGATYDDHIWLIGKRVVDFLLDVTAEELRTRANIGWKSANLLQR